MQNQTVGKEGRSRRRLRFWDLHTTVPRAGTAGSDDLQVKTKLDIIGNEFHIPINSDIREDVNTMCNLAEGIEERAIARTREEDRKEAKKAVENAAKETAKSTSEKFIMSMYSKGYTLDQIADVADLSTADVKAVINKKPAMA